MLLRSTRQRLGLTQTRLARVLGVSRRQLHRWEQGIAEAPRWLPIVLYIWTHPALPQGLREWLDAQPNPVEPEEF